MLVGSAKGTSPHPDLRWPTRDLAGKRSYTFSVISGHVPTPQAACNYRLHFFECRSVLHPTSASQASRLRFASAPVQGGLAHDADNVQWLLKRNCSVTPAQLAGLYLSLCVVSLGIATFFWLQGARMVMLFSWLELLAVGGAFVVYARHAGDGEKIVLQGGQLVVELETAGRMRRAEFNREWVRVEPRDGDGSLIEVSGQGRSVSVGRHVRPELRPALAREIRSVLRAPVARNG